MPKSIDRYALQGIKMMLLGVYDKAERRGQVIKPPVLAATVYTMIDPKRTAPEMAQLLAFEQLSRWARTICAEEKRKRRVKVVMNPSQPKTKAKSKRVHR